MLGMGGCQRSPEVIERRGQGAPAFTFQTQRPTLRRHTCDSQWPPRDLPQPRGTPAIRPPLRVPSPLTAPVTPAQPRRDRLQSVAPRGSCQLLEAALPSPPGQPGCPRGPRPSRIALTTAPDAPSCSVLPWACKIPTPFESPPGHCGMPQPCTTRGVPPLPRSSPESAQSSPAPPPPSPRRPHAGSAPSAGGWGPASWSWPSGPCRRAEPSQGPSAAPGSPRRRPPLPIHWDPALTGRRRPPIG